MGGVWGFVYLAIFNRVTQEGLIIAAHVGLDPGADHRVVDAQGPHGSLALIVPNIGEIHGGSWSLVVCPPFLTVPYPISIVVVIYIYRLWFLRMICRSLGIRAAGNGKCSARNVKAKRVITDDIY